MAASSWYPRRGGSKLEAALEHRMGTTPRVVELTITLDDLDTSQLLREWSWLVPSGLRPIQLTKFGDWFLAGPDGRVYLLDLIEGELTKVADARAEFDRVKDDEENHSSWYLDGFVFRCDAEGLLLERGECYGWKVHPALGGALAFENIQVLSINVCQSVVGQMMRQLKGLPGG